MEMWNSPKPWVMPDGTDISDIEDYEDIPASLECMIESDYDSGDYPKGCGDDEESDCPQHCGSHEDCLDPTLLSDGSKVGHCFGNSLTSDGEAYVKEAVREGGLVSDLWKEVYYWIDFPNECDECGCDSESESEECDE